MKLKHLHPSELAVDLLERSICSVQVASVIADKHGIHSWGHNHSGPTGFGLHAEVHALLRSNRKRLAKSTLYVCAKRKKSGSIVMAKPCAMCAKMISKVGKVVYRDKKGDWVNL